MMTLNRETVNEFNEMLEDVVEYMCEEYSHELISGETLYKVMECFAQAKQAEFAGLVG